jgi:hypothetical protein
MIILNNLSGLCDTYTQEAMEEAANDFIVYETTVNGRTEYGIFSDKEHNINP